jgi:hypothetical protein
VYGPELPPELSMGSTFPADEMMNPSEETLRLKNMRDRLREHTILNLTRVERMEFPGPKTFRRYCNIYGWTQRKIELMAPHRQNGVSPARISQYYDELKAQYILVKLTYGVIPRKMMEFHHYVLNYKRSTP